MRHDPERIEAALAPLVGLSIWATNRAVDMQMFQIGARRARAIERGPRKGETIVVGEYALHLQCAWRIAGPDGIVVASRDLYAVAGPDPDAEPPDFDWERPGSNRRDERLASWLSHERVIEAVTADALGGFRLRVAGGVTFEVIPDDSLDDEHWRLLGPSREHGHFVVTGASTAT